MYNLVSVSLSVSIALSCFLMKLVSSQLQCQHDIEPVHRVLTVNEGASLTLPCVFQNIPDGVTVNIYWKRGFETLYVNKELKETPTTTPERYSLDYNNVVNGFTRSSNLTIAAVNRSDALTYICRARVDDCAIEQFFTVIVKYPASISFIGPRRAPYWSNAEPLKMFVNETENITLSCNSSGNPSPTISMTRIYQDGNLVESVSLAEDTTNDALVINNAFRAHSGIYRCHSTNPLGNDTADVELVVQYAPEVHPSNTDIRAAPNDSIAIGCDVTANPHPLDFYWLKDGIRILDDNEDNAETIPNAISLSCFSTFIRFVIFKLDPQKDYGNYTCVATSSIGTSTATIEISGRPLAPVILEDETQGSYSNSYVLIWSPTIETEENSTQSRNIPITRFIIQYQRQDVGIQNKSILSLAWPDEASSASNSKFGSVFLDNVTKNSSYVGLLCPENDYGIGDCAQFTFTTSLIELLTVTEYTGNACVGTCKGTWKPSAAERHTSVTMVTTSAAIISWCLIS